MDSKAFTVILTENVLHYANLRIGMFLLEINNNGTKKEIYTARFFLQGYTNTDKNLCIHTFSDVKHQRIRFLMRLAAVFSFRACTQDV